MGGVRFFKIGVVVANWRRGFMCGGGDMWIVCAFLSWWSGSGKLAAGNYGWWRGDDWRGKFFDGIAVFPARCVWCLGARGVGGFSSGMLIFL